MKHLNYYIAEQMQDPEFAKEYNKSYTYFTHGTYTRDLYILPTIFYHNGDGFYKTLELAWLKFYVGICWKPKVDDSKT